MNVPALTRHRPADNPFASYRVDGLSYRDDTVSRFSIEHRIDALGGRVAIVGPPGSGKTTLLEDLADRLPGSVSVVRLSGSDRHPHRTVALQLPNPVTRSSTILIDSAEQLGPFGWWSILARTRRARRLVATLHRPGRLPTLVECSTSPALLRDLVRELAPDVAGSIEPTLDALFYRHDGNIRSCFRELYDLFAGRDINVNRVQH